MYSIHRKDHGTISNPKVLKNLQAEDVSLAKHESVTLLSLVDSLGNRFFAIQKKTKGLILFPFDLFENFNQFKGAI